MTTFKEAFGKNMKAAWDKAVTTFWRDIIDELDPERIRPETNALGMMTKIGITFGSLSAVFAEAALIGGSLAGAFTSALLSPPALAMALLVSTAIGYTVAVARRSEHPAAGAVTGFAAPWIAGGALGVATFAGLPLAAVFAADTAMAAYHAYRETRPAPAATPSLV